MIDKNILNSLYSKLLVADYITLKELIELGLNYDDVEKLIKDNKIIIDKSNNYRIGNIYSLYNYGKQLYNFGDVDKSLSVFEKCIEFDPNFNGALNYLFLNAIQNNDYTKAMNYFKRMYVGKSHQQLQEKNVYLFLLNQLTEIPEELKYFASDMDYSAVKVDKTDVRFRKSHNIENDIRKTIINRDYKLALKKINSKKIDFISIIDKITEQLLINNINKKDKSVYDIINDNLYRTNNLKYKELFNYLYKLDLIDNDKCLTNINKMIDAINSKEKLSIANYLQDFYISLYNNNIDKANIIINIIEELSNLGAEPLSCDDLKLTLKKYN